jgi:hypothetical protein
VARINRALVTESYRMGSLDDIAQGEHRDDSDELILGTSQHDPFSRPYFEVLVVETMSPAQEQRLREEVHTWRRPGDLFTYDLVVVGSGVEAAVAMRLNANIQACVIRRRFANAALRDLTNLANFSDATLADDLADHSPDERGSTPTIRRELWSTGAQPWTGISFRTSQKRFSCASTAPGTTAGRAPTSAYWSPKDACNDEPRARRIR